MAPTVAVLTTITLSGASKVIGNISHGEMGSISLNTNSRPLVSKSAYLTGGIEEQHYRAGKERHDLQLRHTRPLT